MKDVGRALVRASALQSDLQIGLDRAFDQLMMQHGMSQRAKWSASPAGANHAGRSPNPTTSGNVGNLQETREYEGNSSGDQDGQFTSDAAGSQLRTL